MYYLVEWSNGNIYFAVDVPGKPGCVTYLSVVKLVSPPTARLHIIWILADLSSICEVKSFETFKEVQEQATLAAL